MPALQQYFLPILIVARTLIAIQLLRSSNDKGLTNLRWLALHFVLTLLGDISLTYLSSRWLFALGQAFGDMAMVVFIHQTFYQNRPSPYRFMLCIPVIYAVAGVAIGLGKPMPPSPTLVDPFIWLWLIVVSYQAYQQVSGDKYVEDWVKARYLLMIAYAVILMTISPVTTTINVFANNLLPSSAWSQVVAGIIALLVWVMPGFFRSFMNRNYQAPAQDALAFLNMSKEELLLQVQGK